MKKQIVSLRGFGYFSKKDQMYYAFCIDLNLAVQGKTISEIEQKMRDNITLYLETELEYNNQHDIDEFPFRRAPIGLLVKYHSIKILYHLKSIKDFLEFNGSYDTDTNGLDLKLA